MVASLKRRKGGSRQRLASSSVANPISIESSLANFLLKQYAWGAMSPQLVQEIASLAVADTKKVVGTGGVLKKLESLSRLGGAGKLANNMHRDILKFQTLSKLPDGCEVQIPFKEKGMQMQKVLLPHEMFASLYHNYPGAWQKMMLPSEDKLSDFWEAQQGHPNLVGNPIKDKPDLSKKCIPLGFHGDEVPITGKGKCWCKSMLTFEWCSLLGVGVTCERMVWVWGTFDRIMETNGSGTLEHFWKVLSWSFFWLQQGKWPTRDWTGTPYPPHTPEGQRAGSWLAEGFCATIFAVMGDLDYLAKTLHLPRSTSTNPCCLCKCTLNGDLSWKHNHQDALWRTALWLPSTWVEWEGRSKCELFSIPGVSACTTALDWMHNKYLGIDQYVYGSVLYVLCFMVLPGRPVENLATCWSFIKQYYKDHRTSNRYQSISKLSMFLRKTGVIKLRGKAGEIRGLGPALWELWAAYMNPGLEIHVKINLLLKLNCKLEALLALHAHELKLPNSAADRAETYAFAMVQTQLEINRFFEASEDCNKSLFSVTAKAHMCLHSILLSRYIHPFMVWCFMGEDFMRKVQKIGEASVKGLQATAVSTKMVAHYRLGLHLQLEELS